MELEAKAEACRDSATRAQHAAEAGVGLGASNEDAFNEEAAEWRMEVDNNTPTPRGAHCGARFTFWRCYTELWSFFVFWCHRQQSARFVQPNQRRRRALGAGRGGVCRGGRRGGRHSRARGLSAAADSSRRGRCARGRSCDPCRSSPPPAPAAEIGTLYLFLDFRGTLARACIGCADSIAVVDDFSSCMVVN